MVMNEPNRWLNIYIIDSIELFTYLIINYYYSQIHNLDVKTVVIVIRTSLIYLIILMLEV